MSFAWIQLSWLGYLYTIFRDNFAVKFMWSIFAIFISQIYTPNEMLLKLIIFLFLVDFATWVFKAIKNRVFRISIFAKGSFKLMLYWIFMLLALSVDQATWFSFFLPMLFVYLTTTDAGSILENVEELGFDVPKPLMQLFKIHKQKFFYDKIREITGQDLLFDYQKDFKTMKQVYIPMIKDEASRKMFEYKIQILEWFVNRIANLSISDYDSFKVQFALLLETVWSELEERLRKEHFNEKDVKKFLERHYLRVEEVVAEINNILSEDAPNKESRIQKKNNLIQAIVRIIYNWIWDNVVWTTRYQLKFK